jgi:hypothetical protein
MILFAKGKITSRPVTVVQLVCGCAIRDNYGIRSRMGFKLVCLWACKLKAKQTVTTGNERHILTAACKQVTRN